MSDTEAPLESPASAPQGSSVRKWLVVAGGFSTLVISAGITFFAFPTLVPNIQEEFGTSLSDVMLAVTVWGVVGAIYSPICGYFIDKFSARPVMLFGIALLVIVTFLIGRVDTLNQLYVLFGVFAIGSMNTTFIPVASVVAKWFHKNQGTAIGLSMLGMGVGGTIIPLFCGWLLDAHEFSWRQIFTALSGVMALAFVPVALWIRDPKPGEGEPPDESKGDVDVDGAAADTDVTLREALFTRSFWGINLGDAVTGLAFVIISTQLVKYLTDSLGDQTTAIQVFSLLSLAQVIGTLILGLLADHIQLRRLAIVCYAFPAIATLLLLGPASAPLAFAFALLCGIPVGGRSAIFPVMLSSSFGATHMAAIYGLSNSFFLVGNALGPIIGSTIYDKTGGPRYVYVAIIVFYLLSTLLISLMRNERKKQPAT